MQEGTGKARTAGFCRHNNEKCAWNGKSPHRQLAAYQHKIIRKHIPEPHHHRQAFPPKRREMHKMRTLHQIMPRSQHVGRQERFPTMAAHRQLPVLLCLLPPLPYPRHRVRNAYKRRRAILLHEEREMKASSIQVPAGITCMFRSNDRFGLKSITDVLRKNPF